MFILFRPQCVIQKRILWRWQLQPTNECSINCEFISICNIEHHCRITVWQCVINISMALIECFVHKVQEGPGPSYPAKMHHIGYSTYSTYNRTLIQDFGLCSVSFMTRRIRDRIIGSLYIFMVFYDNPLQWRDFERNGVSNNWRLECLLNSLFSADRRTHQNSASLTSVRGIHRWSVDSSHKGPDIRNVSIWGRHRARLCIRYYEYISLIDFKFHSSRESYVCSMYSHSAS